MKQFANKREFEDYCDEIYRKEYGGDQGVMLKMLKGELDENKIIEKLEADGYDLCDLTANGDRYSIGEYNNYSRLKLYENYGVLGCEKTPVYSDGNPLTDDYRTIIVVLPNFCEMYKNFVGDIIISIKGISHVYNVRELIVHNEQNNLPCMRWCDDDMKEHWHTLKIVERK